MIDIIGMYDIFVVLEFILMLLVNLFGIVLNLLC